MPVALPPNPFPESVFHATYQRCLDLEAVAHDVEPLLYCPHPLVCARLLGHLLRLVHTDNGRGRLQLDIAAAEDTVQLMKLASTYLNTFIRTFKRHKGSTPPLSEQPSHPSFEDARFYTELFIGECTLDHSRARTAAMHRDDFRCMITHRFDISHDGFTCVETAHIIPPQSSNKKLGDETKYFHSADVWTILLKFSNLNIVPDLAGNKIHRLENILSLAHDTHYLFDTLRLWLEPVEGSPHQYRVHVAKESMRGPDTPQCVTFSTATELPLPNPDYLALHALCCEVAWMSGAAEYVVDVERRMDQTGVLANDGSTANLLASALESVQVH